MVSILFTNAFILYHKWRFYEKNAHAFEIEHSKYADNASFTPFPLAMQEIID